MEREHHHQHPKYQDNPSQNPNKEIAFTDSTRNVQPAADRLKRDEWSEGAVSCLLEAYEAKWTLRNRAKLKGQDWEDVAKHVSGRASGSKSAKTQTQCKNKIESMKKRYRSESAAAPDASSWPLYPRLDLLLRGNGAAVSNPPPPPPVVLTTEEFPAVVPPQAAAVLEVRSGGQNSNDGDRLGKEEGDGGEKNPIDEADSSTPAMENNLNTQTRRKKWRKRSREEYWETGESILGWLAEVVVRSEQARMETLREIERMRAEAEAKRGEFDLKRTEIIANTQLQIAKLFATKNPT